MAVLNTTSPVRSTGAPKLLPSKTVPSSRARTAGFNGACSSRFGGNFYLNIAGDPWSSKATASIEECLPSLRCLYENHRVTAILNAFILFLTEAPNSITLFLNMFKSERVQKEEVNVHCFFVSGISGN